jgi:hypothetical protein
MAYFARPVFAAAFVLLIYSGTAVPQTLVNPDISVVGDMRTNFRTTETAEALGKNEIEFEFRELELTFNAYLNPYMRADAFIGIHGTGGEVHIEEAAITVLRGLPWRLQFRAGKYLLDFGRINTQHPHEWAWLEWPLMHRTMLGEEGLWPVGAQLSTMLALGETAVTLSVNGFSSDAFSHDHDHEEDEHAEENEEDAPAEILGSARLSLFRSFGDSWNAELGASGLYGTYDPADDLKTRIANIDWKLKWRPDAYRAFIWIAEAMYSDRDVAIHHGGEEHEEEHELERIEAFGVFSSLQLRFRRVWDAGVFADFSQDAEIKNAETGAGGTWIGYMPAEETARFSLVYRRETSDLYEFTDNSVVFQIVWALGPHKPHPF